MATNETNIVHEIQKSASKTGARLFKNTRGMFLTMDGKRPVRAGLLADGASDLIGFVPTVITQDMVGKTVAVFAAVEAKTATGRASPVQNQFISFVLSQGGLAGVARSPEDALRILSSSS